MRPDETPDDATWRLPMRKIVCAQWLADLAREKFGDPDALVCPNGIDLDLFHAPPRGKQDRPTVGLLYALVHAGGIDVSIAALEAVMREVPDLLVRGFGNLAVSPEYPLPAKTVYSAIPPRRRSARSTPSATSGCAPAGVRGSTLFESGLASALEQSGGLRRRA